MLTRRLATAILLTLAPALVAQPARTAPAAKPTTRPVPEIRRVIVISMDGGRPDLLLRADCPNVRSLMKSGSYTFWARTTAVSLTLPSHVSMMTGVIPVRHGIHWNEDLALAKPYYAKVPTLFELAHRVGYTTAMASAKTKMDALTKPGTIDWVFTPGGADPAAAARETMEKQSQKKLAPDDAVAENAIHFLTSNRPDVMLVHFASSDAAGHGKGWGSPEQIAAIENIDRNIGRLLAALDSLGLRKETAIILSADHGGAGRTHGADDDRSRHIPWIVSGPGIRRNYDLTALPDLEVNTYDTFANACYLLGIPVPHRVDGKPIPDILENRELLQDTAASAK